ncbi:hypothetical protein CXG81DRAFT_18219 [Caulochytrium protostelioides]|uniref:E3 ubiquitin-protein ligase n=1 Tax=Caulochytrium protostelioides TaxID=1555241 RepID=A0A4P9X9M3_9FUNG|nr:hypothetical protein CXG81DRAFT_18219 [Caulochytrium protostelioides]|eukprot:RKP02044.1 hypothetical protein CXG81DRAFT_18219 [Caulochytrium protostelioides]
MADPSSSAAPVAPGSDAADPHAYPGEAVAVERDPHAMAIYQRLFEAPAAWTQITSFASAVITDELTALQQRMVGGDETHYAAMFTPATARTMTLCNDPKEYMHMMASERFHKRPNFADKVNAATTGQGDGDHPQGPCGHVFRPGEAVYRCRTCGLDETCVMCTRCFQASNHHGHDTSFSVAEGTGGCCDCGDAEAWKQDIGCVHHPLAVIESSQSDDGNSGLSNPPLPDPVLASMKLVVETVLDFALDALMTGPPDLKAATVMPSANPTLLPSATGDVAKYTAVLWNDELHSFDEVIATCKTFVKCTAARGRQIASMVDHLGRELLSIDDLAPISTMARSIRVTDLVVTVRLVTDTLREQLGGALLNWLCHLLHHVTGPYQIALRQVIWEALMAPYRPKVHAYVDVENGYRFAIRSTMPDHASAAAARRSSGDTTGIWHRLDALMTLDARLWKTVRNDIRAMLLRFLVIGPRYKLSLAERFVINMKEMLYGLFYHHREQDTSVVIIGVQLITVPSVAAHLVVHQRLLHTLFDLLWVFYQECNMPETVSLQEYLATGKVSCPVKRLYPPLRCEANLIRDRRHWYFFTDIRYLLQVDRVRQEIFRECQAHPPFLKLCVLWQGMDPHTRKLHNHVEWEREDWAHAFNLGIHISRLVRMVSAAFESQAVMATRGDYVTDVPPDALAEKDALHLTETLAAVWRSLFMWAFIQEWNECEHNARTEETNDTNEVPVILRDASADIQAAIRAMAAHLADPLPGMELSAALNAVASAQFEQELQSQPRLVADTSVVGDVSPDATLSQPMPDASQTEPADADMSDAAAPALAAPPAAPSASTAGAVMSSTGRPPAHLALSTLSASQLDDSVSFHTPSEERSTEMLRSRDALEVDPEFDAHFAGWAHAIQLHGVSRWGIAHNVLVESQSFHKCLQWHLSCLMALLPPFTKAFPQYAERIRRLVMDAARAVPTRFDAAPLRKNLDDALYMIEHPLRNVVWLAQIKAGLWVRNGISIRSQATHYSQRILRECYDRDLVLLQLVGAAWMPNDQFLLVVLDRFNLLPYLRGEPPSAANSQLTQEERVVLMTDLIAFLNTLYMERATVAAFTHHQELEREVIHHLAAAASKGMAFSEIVKRMPDCYSEETTELDACLQRVANFVPPEGLSDHGAFQLKEEFWTNGRLSPDFWHWTHNQKQNTEEQLLKRGLMHQPPTLPTVAPGFEGLDRLFSCETAMTLFLHVIGMACSKADPSSENPDVTMVSPSTGASINHDMAMSPWDWSGYVISNDTLVIEVLKLVQAALFGHDAAEMATWFERPVACDHLVEGMPGSETTLQVSLASLVCRLPLLAKDQKDIRALVQRILAQAVNLSPNGLCAAEVKARGLLATNAAQAADDEAAAVQAEEARRLQKEAARARRAQIMASFQSQQRSFMERQGGDAEASDTEDGDPGADTNVRDIGAAGNDLPDPADIDGAPADDAMDTGVDSPSPEVSSASPVTPVGTWEFPEKHCIICQEAAAPSGGETSHLFGILGLLSQCAMELATVPTLDASTLPYATRRDGWATPIADLDLPIMPDRQKHYDYVMHSGWEGGREIQLSTCHHVIHHDCFKTYFQSVESRHRQQPMRLPPEQTTHGEFLCPMCKRLGNCFLPVDYASVTELAKTGPVVLPSSKTDWVRQTLGMVYDRRHEIWACEKRSSQKRRADGGFAGAEDDEAKPESIGGASAVAGVSAGGEGLANKQTLPFNPQRLRMTQERFVAYVKGWFSLDEPNNWPTFTMNQFEPQASPWFTEYSAHTATEALVAKYPESKQIAATVSLPAGLQNLEMDRFDHVISVFMCTLINAERVDRPDPVLANPSTSSQVLTTLRTLSCVLDEWMDARTRGGGFTYAFYEEMTHGLSSAFVGWASTERLSGLYDTPERGAAISRWLRSTTQDPVLTQDTNMVLINMSLVTCPLGARPADRLQAFFATIHFMAGHSIVRSMTGALEMLLLRRDAWWASELAQGEVHDDVQADQLVTLTQRIAKSLGCTDAMAARVGALGRTRALRGWIENHLAIYLRTSYLLVRVRCNVGHGPDEPNPTRSLDALLAWFQMDVSTLIAEMNDPFWTAISDGWCEVLRDCYGLFVPLRSESLAAFIASAGDTDAAAAHALTWTQITHEGSTVHVWTAPDLPLTSPVTAPPDLVDSFRPRLHTQLYHLCFKNRTMMGMMQPLPYTLIRLPERLDTILEVAQNRVCQNCKQPPNDPAVCLLCGMIVCGQSYCCQVGVRGECSMHRDVCAYHIGIFLWISKGVLLILFGTRGHFLQAPYLDSHGEPDLGLRRGALLYLNHKRYEQIRTMWLQQQIPSFVARKLEGTFDAGGWMTL